MLATASSFVIGDLRPGARPYHEPPLQLATGCALPRSARTVCATPAIAHAATLPRTRKATSDVTNRASIPVCHTSGGAAGEAAGARFHGGLPVIHCLVSDQMSPPACRAIPGRIELVAYASPP